MPRAFTHPGFWAALALLLLNDHVLKGAGLLPSAITGKLSDIAGMIVAPPLAALALGAQSAIARALAAATIGSCFVLIKLVPDAARALEHALALIHVPARIWLDPTDLFALAVLPIGHALSEPSAARAADPRGARSIQHAGVVLAALACIATTGSDDKKKASANSDVPLLENATGEPLTVVIASTEGAGGCALYRDDRISVLTPDAFLAAREVTIEDGSRALLAEDGESARCGAAAIGLPDGESALVFWRDLDDIESFAPDDDERRQRRRVVVAGSPGGFDVEIGSDLGSFELGSEPPEADCPEPEIAHSLEFTALASAQGFLEIGELRELDDGCLEVDWFALEGDTAPDTQRLCVPRWAFPFEPGDTLSVVQQVEPLRTRMLQLTRRDGDAVETQLVIWNAAAELVGSRVRELRPIDCVGAVSSCGAYSRPLEVAIRGRDEPLQSGEEATVEGSEPKETRVLLGAAREVAWSSAACEGGDAWLGASVNLLELRSF